MHPKLKQQAWYNNKAYTQSTQAYAKANRVDADELRPRTKEERGRCGR